LGEVGHGVCIEDKASASGITFAKAPISPLRDNQGGSRVEFHASHVNGNQMGYADSLECREGVVLPLLACQRPRFAEIRRIA
jgi:hypothetical protein